jgi:peptide/nickel transport system substrate-binding protein
MRVPPFDNKLVRQAASYAVDKQGIIQKMLFGLGREVATVVNPMAFGYDPSVQPYPYDPAKAKQLLAQAGYPKGLDVTIHSASTGGWRQVGEAVAQMLTDAGIRTNYKIWDPGPAYIKFLTGDGKGTHGHYWSWGYYSVFDADAILHALFHTEQGGLYGRWYTRVAGLDKLIDEARVTLNADKRKQTYAQIQRLLKEEAPALAMFHQYDMLGINKRIEYEARGDEWIWVFEAKIRKAM